MRLFHAWLRDAEEGLQEMVGAEVGQESKELCLLLLLLLALLPSLVGRSEVKAEVDELEFQIGVEVQNPVPDLEAKATGKV